MMKYYSAIKKNEVMPFAATWMDLETVILSEVNQKEEEKSKKEWHTWTYKTERDSHLENEVMVGCGGDKGKR